MWGETCRIFNRRIPKISLKFLNKTSKNLPKFCLKGCKLQLPEENWETPDVVWFDFFMYLCATISAFLK